MTSGSKSSSLTKLLLIGGFGLLLLAACENDLKDVRRISEHQVTSSVEKTYGVEIVYSDSAKVKAKLLTPELYYHKTANPYYRMPKGVTILLYDDKQQVENTITADSAFKRDNERLTQLMGHVLIKKQDGSTFASDELFWNEVTRKFYSNTLVTFADTKGDTLNGYGFESTDKFYYKFRTLTGDLVIPEQPAAPATPTLEPRSRPRLVP